MNLRKGFNYVIECLLDIIGCYKLTELTYPLKQKEEMVAFITSRLD